MDHPGLALYRESLRLLLDSGVARHRLRRQLDQGIFHERRFGGGLHGIAAALPVMQRQGSGQVINMASIGAYTVSPTAAVYCATKFAVAAVSEGLRQEVGGDIGRGRGGRTSARRRVAGGQGRAGRLLPDHVPDTGRDALA